ncbi:LacI family DNA-binding transcriptional regulator [Actinocorallia populi]|uniref:LacI family DNA-binding transcriptional regulator n=1 Tax=Actinocorallia populi TaxID=2079200 RepID=UPI000D092960|nr:LacI family DNA-binding transcriptional regulator [Actinocorallia populi]
MASSADVAARAGVSRSTVSQIMNGHGHRFKPEMVEHVRQVAQELGYRPSVAGRTLARGTSDIVITLIPNITFGPRLRELIDRITAELAQAGKTNLLRLASSDDTLEDAILGLRPVGVWSVAPLSPEQRARLATNNVPVIEQSRELQVAIDAEIGALQAAHLAETGYTGVAVAMPVDQREQPFATARERGVVEWCAKNGVDALPTLHLNMERGTASETAFLPPHGGRTGFAAYNDEAALAVLGAARRAGKRVPEDIGVIGVDNSTVAHVSEPSLTTIDIDVEYSAHEIVKALLLGPQSMPEQPLDIVKKQITVVPGESTSRMRNQGESLFRS